MAITLPLPYHPTVRVPVLMPAIVDVLSTSLVVLNACRRAHRPAKVIGWRTLGKDKPTLSFKVYTFILGLDRSDILGELSMKTIFNFKYIV
jgi:hypothetical protein